MSKNRFAVVHTQSNSIWINIKLSALQYWTRANHERKRKWIYCCSGGLHQPIRHEIGYSFRIVAAFSLSTLFSTIYIILSDRIRYRRGNCIRWNAPSNASRCDSKPSRRPYWLKLAHSLMRANKYSAPCARRVSGFVLARLFLFYLFPNAYVNTTENNIQAVIIMNGKSDSSIDMSKFPLIDLDASSTLPNPMKCGRLFSNSVLLLIWMRVKSSELNWTHHILQAPNRSLPWDVFSIFIHFLRFILDTFVVVTVSMVIHFTVCCLSDIIEN